ncbi:hypothetical protein M0Q50_10570 [bacterium]|jgi:predicted RNase H-related nuclease YkuK (DUF458 family)|nr:hypothetical protein [bacterium]
MEDKKYIFKKINGELIDNVEKYVKDWIKENPFGLITVGCDSQVHGHKIKYSIVICMQYIDKYGIGHGAHVISTSIWEKRLSNKNQLEEMPLKLWKEAEYVLDIANLVNGNDETFKKRITVHLDYNSEESQKSNILFASGIGYITGMGYKAEGKPDAWCATHLADAFCRK